MSFFQNSQVINRDDRNTSNSICLDSINILSDMMASQFDTYARKNLQTIKLHDSILQDTVLFSLLSQLVNVKTLEISNTAIIRKIPAPIKKRVMCNVETIILEYNDFSILDIINAPKLHEFRFAMNNIHLIKPLEVFLCLHSSIKILEIKADGCDIMNFFSELPAYEFSLEHLSLISNNFNLEASDAYEENCLNFLKAHKTTIKTLELKANLCLGVLNFLLKSFRLLKTLELKLSKLPHVPQFYTIKKARKSVKNLCLIGTADTNTIISIIMLYPAINNLFLCDYDYRCNDDFINNLLLHVTEICKSLVELRISRMPELKHTLKFPKLKKLQIAYISDINEILKVIYDNPSIETLVIDFVFRRQSNRNILLSLANCGVKHLSIFAEPIEIKKIHDFFMNYWGGLETMTLKFELKSVMKTFHFKFSTQENSATSDSLIDDVTKFFLDELFQYYEELANI